MDISKGRPNIFTFKQTFKYEADIDLNLVLEEFADKFNSLLTTLWLQYWNANGEQIISTEWKLKYGDYIKVDSNSSGNKESELIPQNCEPIITIEKETLLEDFSAAWDALWTEHSTEFYTLTFNIFSSVFNDYFLDLSSAVTSSEEYCSFNDSSKEEEANELEQLMLLGLPRAFGCNYSGNQYKTRSNSNKNFSDFNTSAEMPKHNIDSDSEDNVLHRIQKVKKNRSTQKINNRLIRDMPVFMQEDRSLWKYWFQRFSLFSRFDEGICLDREGWFSVTPEKIATHLATRLSCDIVVDAFCGCGGNAIQFAKTCRKVIAIDIDPIKVEMAKHNAKVYGVADRIDFIVGDFLHLSRNGKFLADLVFLSPPWGGPKYKRRKNFDIEKCLLPISGTQLMACARIISSNIALFLPRNSNLQQIIQLAGIGNRCELEHNYLNMRLVALTALYGEHILSKKDPNS